MRCHGRTIIKIALCAAITTPGYADTEVGKLALVNGEVRITKSENDSTGRIAKANDVIFNMDIVKTGDNGAAKILFTDQSVMDVGPASALKVSNYALKDIESRTGTFSILYGKLRALVTKKVGPGGKLEVRSGDAVMGVRGTEFLVDASKSGTASAGTQIVVVSGLVQVSPPAGGPAIPVGTGQMVVASPKTFAAAATAVTNASATGTTSTTSSGSKGAADVVTKVSPEQMQSMVSTAKAQDNTFLGSVTIAPSTSGGSSPTPIMQNISTLVASMPLPPPPSESGSKPVIPMTVVVPTFLPPVNIVPGNQVHLSVNVQ